MYLRKSTGTERKLSDYGAKSISLPLLVKSRPVDSYARVTAFIKLQLRCPPSAFYSRRRNFLAVLRPSNFSYLVPSFSASTDQAVRNFYMELRDLLNN